jgi:hypothetical protein
MHKEALAGLHQKTQASEKENRNRDAEREPFFK